VCRLDELVIKADSQRLSIAQRQLEFTGEFVYTHCFLSSPSQGLLNSSLDSINPALFNPAQSSKNP